MSNIPRFITFEGGEGSGKSTQIKMLARSLEDAGFETVITREPGGTPEAEKIRELLVSRDGGDWSETAECFLFFAARAMHVRDLIKPALHQGKIVLCDRFTDSTRAYQSYGHGFPLETIEAVKNLAIGNFEPDITLILDIDPVRGLERSNKRNSVTRGDLGGQTEDRFERLDLSFHERLREGYLQIARDNPDRCIVLDAAKSIDLLADEIRSAVMEKV